MSALTGFAAISQKGATCTSKQRVTVCGLALLKHISQIYREDGVPEILTSTLPHTKTDRGRS